MREIKFRAWDKKRKEWVHKESCSILGGWMNRPNGNHVRLEELNDIEIVQYTGLRDSKRTKEYPEGQGIYEGDIIEADGRIFTVVYDRASFAIKAPHREKVIALLSVAQHNGCQVIGNIYENPELLEANR